MLSELEHLREPRETTENFLFGDDTTFHSQPPRDHAFRIATLRTEQERLLETQIESLLDADGGAATSGAAASGAAASGAAASGAAASGAAAPHAAPPVKSWAVIVRGHSAPHRNTRMRIAPSSAAGGAAAPPAAPPAAPLAAPLAAPPAAPFTAPPTPPLSSYWTQPTRIFFRAQPPKSSASSAVAFQRRLPHGTADAVNPLLLQRTSSVRSARSIMTNPNAVRGTVSARIGIYKGLIDSPRGQFLFDVEHCITNMHRLVVGTKVYFHMCTKQSIGVTYAINVREDEDEGPAAPHTPLLRPMVEEIPVPHLAPTPLLERSHVEMSQTPSTPRLHALHAPPTPRLSAARGLSAHSKIFVPRLLL